MLSRTYARTAAPCAHSRPQPHLGVRGPQPCAAGLALVRRAARRRRDRQSALAVLPLHVARRPAALSVMIRGGWVVWQGGKSRHPSGPLGLLLCSLLRALSETKRAHCIRHALRRHEPSPVRRAFVPGYSSDTALVRSRTSLLVCFTDAWALGEDVQPLFPVPSCVLVRSRLEDSVTKARCRRNHPPGPPASCRGATRRRTEAEGHLVWRDAPWPAVGDDDSVTASPYQTKRSAMARPLLVPRVPMFGGIRPRPGPLGVHPWMLPRSPAGAAARKSLHGKHLDLTDGATSSARFLRSVYLGESVAPLPACLQPPLAVIPWDPESERALLDAAAAGRSGLSPPGGLDGATLKKLVGARTAAAIRMTFAEQLDYYGKLSYPVSPSRRYGSSTARRAH